MSQGKATKVTRKTAKKTTRGGSAKGRTSAGSVASASKAPAAANAPKPAPLGGELSSRLGELDRQACLIVAVRKCEPGSRRGKGSKVWSLPRDVIHDIAEAHVLHHKPAAEIRDRFAGHLRTHTINARTLDTWLRLIRDGYDKQYAAQLSKITEHDQAIFQSGDMIGLSAHVFARISPMILSAADTILSESPSANDLHVFLRYLEVMNTGAKTQAEARLKETQRDKMLAVFRTEIDKVKGGKATPEETVDFIAKLIEGEMLGTTDRSGRGEAA